MTFGYRKRTKNRLPSSRPSPGQWQVLLLALESEPERQGGRLG